MKRILVASTVVLAFAPALVQPAVAVPGISASAPASPPQTIVVQVQSKRSRASCAERCRNNCSIRRNPARCEQLCIAKRC